MKTSSYFLVIAAGLVTLSGFTMMEIISSEWLCLVDNAVLIGVILMEFKYTKAVENDGLDEEDVEKRD